MNIRNLLSKKETGEENLDAQPKEEAAKEGEAFGNEALYNAAKDAVAVLLRLKSEGKLNREPEDYIRNEEFRKLLREFDPAAAVRVFDAEQEVNEAYERGKAEAVNEIYRMHEMPRPIRSGAGAVAETDFSKMSTKEFNKLKEKLAKA